MVKTQIAQKKICNLGLAPLHRFPAAFNIKTIPIIEIVAHSYSQDEWEKWHDLAGVASAWIFSSKTAAALFLESYKQRILETPKIFSVGKATTEAIRRYGGFTIIQATEEMQEGLFQVIKETLPQGGTLFWPRSKEARTYLSTQLINSGYELKEMPLYSTQINHACHPCDLNDFDALLFTSPSTVNAFLEIYGTFPKKEIFCIGPITYQKVVEQLEKTCGKDLPEILMLGDLF